MMHLARTPIVLFALFLGFAPLGVFAGKKEESAAASPYPGYMAVEPPLIINLANPRKARYLKINIQFYIETQSDADLVTLHMPRLRDRMITLLGGRDGEQIMSGEARDQLRIELLENLRKLMIEQTGRPVISAIYFTDFIVQ
ncbi:flagellar basal body protein FliL [Caldichromatium japonicum]|uniref:Flagellar protein FliL n=1 Tax=Caldichromatium japonicum TaxID=2699430 RepID=A0A6G7VEJ9_9GAMM|nr:flagellar basal body-associated FliL family protein [Caldichromatium japonicum]QIK38278.1 flagellar basal body protein FliL [Caldichromatium japonicum]